MEIFQDNLSRYNRLKEELEIVREQINSLKSNYPLSSIDRKLLCSLIFRQARLSREQAIELQKRILK
jgi:hypothetical protein